MKKKFFLLYFIVLFHSCIYSSAERFQHRMQSDSSWLHKTVTIDSYVDNEKVGFIAYDKIAVAPFCVIHSLYIYPEYRNKGYGRRLLNYTCAYLKSCGTKKIYLQPGPFELDEDGYVENNVPSRKLKLKRLVKFYKNSQFAKTNRALSYCAALLYKCMHIDENSDYLMVKVLK